MTIEFRPPKRSWPQKFRHAFRGMRMGIRGQSSFTVHFVAAGVVIGAAAILRATPGEWCLLVLCIAVVLAAEMFNSALEHLARAVDRSENRHIAAALDIGSAAVLMAAIGAAIVGAVILLVRLASWLQSHQMIPPY